MKEVEELRKEDKNEEDKEIDNISMINDTISEVEGFSVNENNQILLNDRVVGKVR